MAHQRAPDSRREKFRRYLEKAGVVDSLVSVLLSLYEQPDKPDDPLEYVKQHIGAVGRASAESEALQQEVMDLKQRCAHLMEENKDLRTKLQRYENATEDGGKAK